MAAQTGDKRPHRGVAPQIRKLKTRYPELSNSAIAKRVGCTTTNVEQVLQRFLGKGSVDDLRSFQEHKADVYDAIQQRLLLSVTQAKINKTPAVQAITGAAILEDKARLIRGQATSINMTAVVDLIEVMRGESQARVIDASPADHGERNSG